MIARPYDWEWEDWISERWTDFSSRSRYCFGIRYLPFPQCGTILSSFRAYAGVRGCKGACPPPAKNTIQSQSYKINCVNMYRKKAMLSEDMYKIVFINCYPSPWGFYRRHTGYWIALIAYFERLLSERFIILYFIFWSNLRCRWCVSSSFV